MELVGCEDVEARSHEALASLVVHELMRIYNIVDEDIIIGQDFLYDSKDKMLITIYDDYIE